MSTELRFNKTALDALPLPPRGTRVYYRDTEVKGLQLQVTGHGARTFYLYRRIHGKPTRVKLGCYPDIGPAKARRLAEKAIGEIAEGKDPHAERRARRSRGVTLEKAFNRYLVARQNLKPKTRYDYTRVMATAFPDWQPRRVVEITKDMVARRHARLGRDRGEAYANLAMRILRAVLNFAALQYEDSAGRPLLPENPVKRLSQTRTWYRERRRRTYIAAYDLPSWYEAVEALRGEGEGTMAETVADFLQFVLFTGLRRQEAAALRWAQVDLKARTVTVTDTKNREDHTLPLSDFLASLLTRRQAVATSPYVFPGEGPTGALVEPRYQRAKVIERSGVEFTIHDLRRTFITVAERLDIPAYALKRLLNHKMANDVTAGYIVTDVERLRRPMQQITDYLLSAAGARPSADVVALDAAPDLEDR